MHGDYYKNPTSLPLLVGEGVLKTPNTDSCGFRLLFMDNCSCGSARKRHVIELKSLV